MLEYKKIFIDSRFRTSDSVSSSNFRVELPTTVTLPENAIYYITDVCIPNTWTTITENYNDTLYLAINLPDAQTIPTWRFYKIQLTVNNYTTQTLADQIKFQLNLNFPGNFDCTADTINNKIIIATTNQNLLFHLITDNELVLKKFYSSLRQGFVFIDQTQMPYDINNLNSCNKIVTNVTDNIIDNAKGFPYISRFIELFIATSIYITSPNFGTFDTLACTGMNLTNIVKKVPINVPFGYLITDSLYLEADFKECGSQTLRTLEFHLRTADGRYLPLKDSDVSFTILFGLNPNK